MSDSRDSLEFMASVLYFQALRFTDRRVNCFSCVSFPHTTNVLRFSPIYDTIGSSNMEEYIFLAEFGFHQNRIAEKPRTKENWLSMRTGVYGMSKYRGEVLTSAKLWHVI